MNPSNDPTCINSNPTCITGGQDANGVNEAMNRLHELVGRLDAETTGVVDSLVRVLRDPNPQTGWDAKPRQPTCKLAEEIDGHCDRIVSALDRLSDISDRLDL